MKDQCTAPAPVIVIAGKSLASIAIVLFGAFSASASLAQSLQQSVATTSTSVSLDAGFLPDPYTLSVPAGGSRRLDNAVAGCTGYFSDDISFTFDYSGGSTLGVYVSASIDTTLALIDSDGQVHCNDDHPALAQGNPGIYLDAPAAGRYGVVLGTYYADDADMAATVAVTEFAPAMWHDLELPAAMLAGSDIDFGDDSSAWARDGECDDPRFEGDGMAAVTNSADLGHDASDCRSLYASGRIRLSASGQQSVQTSQAGAAQTGVLDSSDGRGFRGGYAEYYSFNASAGNGAVIDLNSDDFDTYLRVTSPSGEIFENDDFQSSLNRSVVSIDSTEAGSYQVEVSSFGEAETGPYTLLTDTQANASEVQDQSHRGRLEAGDITLESGEYFDTYTFTGSPGQRLDIELRSNDFDTYAILVSPSGEQQENDDANGSDSQLLAELTENGSYEVWVTSYSPGETGDYSLSISNQGASSSASRSDAISLTAGESVSGQLSAEDSRAITDGPEDSYVFTGEVGDAVVVDLESGAFDTYLTLITPTGEHIENDDHEASLQQSRVALDLPSTGRYRVIVSSYEGQGLGDYRLSLGTGGNTPQQPAATAAGGQIYGLFVGVADYPGQDSDLPLTDQDAERARDALIQGAGMPSGNGITLLNESATRARFDQALDQIGDRAGADDTLVIFYSGHGSRVPRSTGYDSRDPDGFDETMELYDGSLLDDELALMLDELDVGKVLLVMDACFSGGFAKDIVSRPGRMGLFSSEEDVLSQVASKFQAGGYLSFFFEEALTQGYADRDGNGELTAIELSQYLHQRFDADVKSFGTEEYVRARGPQASYQKLVIDRGGIGPYNVLFTRQ